MADKEYVCAYKYCLHHGQKIKESEAVVVGRKKYHWDCAMTRQQIEECVALYMSYIEDKTQYPIARRAINSLVFKNNVPIEYILNNISKSKKYYSDKPAQALYGLKRLYWEIDIKRTMGWKPIDC